MGWPISVKNFIPQWFSSQSKICDAIVQWNEYNLHTENEAAMKLFVSKTYLQEIAQSETVYNMLKYHVRSL